MNDEGRERVREWGWMGGEGCSTSLSMPRPVSGVGRCCILKAERRVGTTFSATHLGMKVSYRSCQRGAWSLYFPLCPPSFLFLSSTNHVVFMLNSIVRYQYTRFRDYFLEQLFVITVEWTLLSASLFFIMPHHKLKYATRTSGFLCIVSSQT